MTFSVGDRARLAGCRVSGFDSIGSTNAAALQAAEGGDVGRHWFAALEQTEGRGRRGRPWQSQKGNLAASLLLVFDAPGDYSGLGFVAGVALCDTLLRLAPKQNFALKWPNDLLLNGKKLSGILLEAKSVSGGRHAIAIGIGVNVVAAPEGLPAPATSLAEAGVAVSAEEVFAALTDSFAETFVRWQNGYGLPDVLDLWRRHAAGIGAPISVTTPTGPVSGIFETLDAQGRLLIRTDKGELKPISAGDVHFGTVASTNAI